jgi:beta-glucosidase
MQTAHVVVVLQTGSPVTLPWHTMVDGIVAEYEAGACSGSALRKILYGEVNPSGHLAETWPLRQEDVPCACYYDVHINQSQYREGIYTGYRYYDTYDIPVTFPFGYGLSYTEYAYTDLTIEKQNDVIHGSLKVRNLGQRAGRAVVQIYVGMKNSRIARPSKELKAFASVVLDAGDEKRISFTIPMQLLKYYDAACHSWQMEKGTYTFMAGTSCMQILLQEDMDLDGIEDPYSSLEKTYIHYDEGMVIVSDDDFAKMLQRPVPALPQPRPFTPDTTLTELKSSKLGKFINAAIKRILQLKVLHGVDDASVYNAPMRQMLWLKDHYTWDTVYAAVAYMNHHGLKEWHEMLHQLKKHKG